MKKRDACDFFYSLGSKISMLHILYPLKCKYLKKLEYPSCPKQCFIGSVFYVNFFFLFFWYIQFFFPRRLNERKSFIIIIFSILKAQNLC